MLYTWFRTAVIAYPRMVDFWHRSKYVYLPTWFLSQLVSTTYKSIVTGVWSHLQSKSRSPIIPCSEKFDFETEARRGSRWWYADPVCSFPVLFLIVSGTIEWFLLPQRRGQETSFGAEWYGGHWSQRDGDVMKTGVRSDLSAGQAFAKHSHHCSLFIAWFNGLPTWPNRHSVSVVLLCGVRCGWDVSYSRRSLFRPLFACVLTASQRWWSLSFLFFFHACLSEAIT